MESLVTKTTVRYALFVIATLLPEITRADRFGICEYSNCGGGTINGLFALLLIVFFLSSFGLKKASIFVATALAPTGVALLFGMEKGIVGIVFLIGIYAALFIAPWIIGKLKLDDADPNQPRE